MFLGYNEENKTFRIWDIERKEVIFSRDITVKESESINPNLENKEKQEDEVFVEIGDVQNQAQSGDKQVEVIDLENQSNEEEHQVENQPRVPEIQPVQQRQIEVIDLEDISSEEEIVSETQQSNLRKSTRQRKAIEQFGKVLMYNAEEKDIIPLNYNQMLRNIDRNKWIESTQQELDSLTKMNTWTLVYREAK